MKSWAEPVRNDDTKFHCKYCLKTVSCGNGIKDLLGHANSAKHINVVKDVKSSGKLDNFKLSSSSDCAPNEIDAEILLTLNMIEENWSFNSASSLPVVLKRILPNNSTVSKIHLGRDKLRYLTRYGLLPYYEKSLKEDMKDIPFSIFIDESTDCDREFLCVLIRFSDKQSLKVTTRLLQLVHIESSKAADIVSALLSSLTTFGLDPTNMLAVMSDNCNTMRGEHGGVMALLEKGGNELLDVHGCTLHLLHVAAKHGFNAMDTHELISDCLYDLHSHFSNSPKNSLAIRKIAEVFNVDLKKFLRHVETRWLQLFAVICRLLEHYEIVTEYIKQNSENDKSRRFKRIAAAFENPLFFPSLLFTRFLMGRLMPFEKSFQSDEVMIHLLYAELRRLLLEVLVLCVQESKIDKKHPWKTDFKSEANKLPAKQLMVGDDTRAAVELLSERDKIAFYVSVVRPFYEKLLEKLLEHIPFRNKVLRYLMFVDPSEITSKKFPSNVVGFAKLLSKSIFPEGHIDDLTSEVRTLRMTVVKPPKDVSVQAGWLQLLPDSMDKYPYFRRVLAIAISLPHGNAVTERQFSIMSDILTKKRSLLDDGTLHALLFLKSAIGHLGGISNIPITTELRISCRNAHARYVEAARQRKMKEEEAVMKRAQQEIEKDITSAIDEDSKIKSLTAQHVCASTAVTEEKRNMDRKDKLIRDLINARDNDKENYEKALKEKERLETLVGKRKHRILDSLISSTAAKQARKSVARSSHSCDLDESD